MPDEGLGVGVLFCIDVQLARRFDILQNVIDVEAIVRLGARLFEGTSEKCALGLSRPYFVRQDEAVEVF